MTKQIGFLFDVDGTLTTYHGNDSVIDPDIISVMHMISENQIPIGLVTGRSVTWVQSYFFPYLSRALKESIRISGEFGLVTWNGKEKQSQVVDNGLASILKQIQRAVVLKALNEQGLQTIESYSAPEKLCLWIEPKEVMVTFRTLPAYGLTLAKLMALVKPIVTKVTTPVKIEANPAAVDILPSFASKQYGAEEAIKMLDPSGKISHWFAFGDSEADREMEKVRNCKVQFFLVPRGDTKTVHQMIEELCTKYVH